MTSQRIPKNLEDSLTEWMTPDGIAAAAAWLRAASDSLNRPRSDRAFAAARECEWLADMMTQLLGVEEHNAIIDELGL